MPIALPTGPYIWSRRVTHPLIPSFLEFPVQCDKPKFQHLLLVELLPFYRRWKSNIIFVELTPLSQSKYGSSAQMGTHFQIALHGLDGKVLNHLDEM